MCCCDLGDDLKNIDLDGDLKISISETTQTKIDLGDDLKHIDLGDDLKISTSMTT